jgi:hypothetical protein
MAVVDSEDFGILGVGRYRGISQRYKFGHESESKYIMRPGIYILLVLLVIDRSCAPLVDQEIYGISK